MKNLFLLWALLITTLISFSQTKPFVLEGNIESDSLSISNISIRNKTLKTTTQTNKLGAFKLPVRLTDSIEISAIHIKKITFVVSKKLSNSKNITFKIENTINTLDEIVLNNILSKSALDFSAAYKPSTKPDFEKMRRQEIRRLNETDPTKKFQGGNLLGGISLISKLFKKKTKKKPKKWKPFKDQFLNEFGISFFTDDLQISELIVDEFLIYCKQNQTKDIPLLYFQNNKIDVIDFFVKQAEKYKKLRIDL